MICPRRTPPRPTLTITEGRVHDPPQIGRKGPALWCCCHPEKGDRVGGHRRLASVAMTGRCGVQMLATLLGRQMFTLGQADRLTAVWIDTVCRIEVASPVGE